MPTDSNNNNGASKPIVNLEDIVINNQNPINPTPSIDDPAPDASDPKTDVLSDPINTVVPPTKGDIVSINDVDYTIDDNGNALDNTGKVVYTSDIVLQGLSNVEQVSATVEIDPNIEALNNISKHEVIIDGMDVKFTPEYIAAREEALIEKVTEESRTEGITSFLNNNPDIAEIVKYKEKFGSLEGFGQTVDYTSIDIATLNDVSRTELIIQAEMKRGVTRERAERIAKLSTGDVLVSDAKEALEYLVKDQTTRINSIRTEQERAITEYKVNYNKEIGVAYNQDGTIKDLNINGSLYDDVVNKGKILNLPIPTKGIVIVKDNKQVLYSRQELFDYLSKPQYEDNGQMYSQAEVDLYDKLNDRKYRSLMALMAMNGLESLVKAEADRKIVVRVKQQASNTTNPNQGVSAQVQTGSGLKVKLD